MLLVVVGFLCENSHFPERKFAKMTDNIPQGSLLDVLKKKMGQTKEEMERYKDECEEYNKRLHAECMRREEGESGSRRPQPSHSALRRRLGTFGRTSGHCHCQIGGSVRRR
ncbi:hypothetical protein Zmor_006130 [Zophobas morio]|uniref:Uncharacterized protein n=1 Tax=Zophobas morio TaxID=2755281 RepID=A0AA38IU71_9CUCU|nr:hypothetical protein Zmor_006130 [Zophobas morio]